MIKLTYKQEQYHYDNVAAQPYDVKVEMELKDDANITEAMAMFFNFLKMATYRIDKKNIMEAIEEYFEGDFFH